MCHTLWNSNLLVAFIGLAGTLIGVWLGGYISRRANREILTNQAKVCFAGAFTEALVKLCTERNVETGYAVDILKAHYPVHLAAYHVLRATLPHNDRLALDIRWRTYTGVDEFKLREEQDFYRFSRLFAFKSVQEQNDQAIIDVYALLEVPAPFKNKTGGIE
jgi:hypothetical protein